MSREHRAIAALHPVGFPVPRPLGLCADPDLNGAPFYVMDYVDGLVVRDADEARRSLEIPTRRVLSHSLTDVLARLHSVDIDAVGLGDLGRREGYVARQLRRWLRQVESTPAPSVPTSVRSTTIWRPASPNRPPPASCRRLPAGQLHRGA